MICQIFIDPFFIPDGLWVAIAMLAASSGVLAIVQTREKTSLREKFGKNILRFIKDRMPGLKIFFLLISIATLVYLGEISLSQGAPVPPNEERGPYLQMGTPTSIVVRWRTINAMTGRVRFGTDPDNLNRFADGRNNTREHEIELSGLSPQTKYYYAISSSDNEFLTGEDYYFVTAPRDGVHQKVRLWVLGDSGTGNDNARAVRDAYYKFTGSTHTDLWIMLGDNAYKKGTDPEYQRAVFEMYPTMLSKSVLWPAFGNHDGKSSNSEDESGPFYDAFTLPKNAEAGGAASGTEAYYSWNFANIHFICLNSHDVDRSQTGEMLTWLKKDLDTNEQEWIIAFWHHPPYSKGNHDSDEEYQLIEMRENALPILEEGGVDLVLSGHSHSYERSYLLNGYYGKSGDLRQEHILDHGDGKPDGDGFYHKPTLGAAPHEGTVYVVAGSSGKTRKGGTFDHPVMYISYKKLGSVVLDIEGDQLDITFLDDVGNWQDYFTIVKGEGIVRTTSTEISSFSGEGFDGMAALNWMTLQEVNAAGFEILRSTPVSGNYRTVATYREIPALKAAGHSPVPLRYTYTDSVLAPGVEYRYKLMSIGANGNRRSYGPISITPFSSKRTLNSTVSGQNFPCPVEPFGTITISPDFELKGPGKNIDSIDLWEAPEAENTLMFVTAKDNSLLEVWEYPFKNNAKPPLNHPTFSNSNVNGIVVDQETDRMYIAISEPSSTVSVFSLPDLTFVMNFNKWWADYQGEPNIALLKLTTGEKRVYVSADDVVYIHDAATGKYLDQFKPAKGLETMAGDHFYQRLYIPDEDDRTGVYVYHPDGKPYYQNGTNRFGEQNFRKDAEGIIIYTCPPDGLTDNGSGFIVVADQIGAQTEFEFFDRENWHYLGTLKIKGVSNTDGIASYQKPLPNYPLGIFVAINDDSSTAGVGWDVIFRKMRMAVDENSIEASMFEKEKN